MSEVGIAALRHDLKDWIARAHEGDEVIVTDRGRPVARLTSISTPPALEQMIADGLISQPRGPRPRASTHRRIKSKGPVSDYVSTNRESGSR